MSELILQETAQGKSLIGGPGYPTIEANLQGGAKKGCDRSWFEQLLLMLWHRTLSSLAASSMSARCAAGEVWARAGRSLQSLLSRWRHDKSRKIKHAQPPQVVFPTSATLFRRFSHFCHSFSSFFVVFPRFLPQFASNFFFSAWFWVHSSCSRRPLFFRSGPSAELRENAPANKKEISSKITNCVRITSTFDAVFYD